MIQPARATRRKRGLSVGCELEVISTSLALPLPLSPGYGYHFQTLPSPAKSIRASFLVAAFAFGIGFLQERHPHFVRLDRVRIQQLA
jgi:hypothetical protein